MSRRRILHEVISREGSEKRDGIVSRCNGFCRIKIFYWRKEFLCFVANVGFGGVCRYECFFVKKKITTKPNLSFLLFQE